MEYKMLNWHRFGDERGSLVALEGGSDIPFAIKRIFYIFGTKDRSVIRGCHANLYSSFTMVMLKGSCNVMIDDGSEKTDVRLENPTQGIYIGKMLWKEMYNFSDGSVMAVLSDQHYNPNEYIRDYNQYLEMVRSAASA